MTRSEFLARFTIQHASVTRAIDFANKLELSEEFDGWEEDDGAPWEEIMAIIAAAENVVTAGVNDVTQEHILVLDRATKELLAVMPEGDEDESPDSDA